MIYLKQLQQKRNSNGRIQGSKRGRNQSVSIDCRFKKNKHRVVEINESWELGREEGEEVEEF